MPSTSESTLELGAHTDVNKFWKQQSNPQVSHSWTQYCTPFQSFLPITFEGCGETMGVQESLLQVLTRQAQLKMKQDKVKEKKEKAEEKKVAAQTKKEAAEAKKKEAAEKKLAKQAAKEAAKAAKEKEKQEKKSKAKANSSKRPADAVEQEPEESEHPEPQQEAEKPKRLRKAKVTTQAEEAEDVEEKDDEVEAEIEPQAKKKAKKDAAAKAEPKGPKAKAKSKAKGGKSDQVVDTDPEPTTPRKKLFTSDDEEEHQENQHLRQDGKGGVKPLEQIFNEDIPKRLAAAAAASRDEENGKGNPPGESSKPSAKRKAAAKGAPKATAKGKASKTKKTELSPFAKKQQQRRKKVETESMQVAPEVDMRIQGIIIQHCKATMDLTVDGLKEYLYSKVQKKFTKSFLNPYIMRGTCGIKVKLQDWDVHSEIFHFKRPGTTPAFNGAATVSYVAASLMVSKLNSVDSKVVDCFAGWVHKHVKRLWW